MKNCKELEVIFGEAIEYIKVNFTKNKEAVHCWPYFQTIQMVAEQNGSFSRWAVDTITLQLMWAHTWRMSFNPDPLKQAVELTFSRKKMKLFIQ